MPNSSDVLCSKPAEHAPKEAVIDRLENVEADIGALGALFETRLFSIAEELRRAEARDEWMSAQLREARRALRDQGRMLEEIRSVLVRESKGFF